MKNKLILVIFAVGILLRFYPFWNASLWYDENFSLLLSRLPLVDMLMANAGDVHPPLWYLFAWGASHLLPNADWSIRLPSVIFSILSLFAFWRIVRLTTDDTRVQTVALAIMAIAPVQIYYAQEGRMYALLEFFVLRAWMAVLERKWVEMAVAVTGMVYTQNVGLLYAACIFAAGLVHQRRDWKPLLLGMLAAALAWSAWAPSMLAQMSMMHGAHWIPAATPGAVVYNMAQMFYIAVPELRLEITAMVLFCGWLMLGVACALRQPETYLAQHKFTLLLLAFGPVLLETAASWIWQPVLLHRTLIGISPFLYLLMAAPARMMTSTRRAALVTITLLVPALLVWYYSWFVQQSSITPGGSDRETMAIIESGWQDGDVVYHQWNQSIVNHLPYTLHPSDQYKMPECGPVLGNLSRQTLDWMRIPVSPLEDLVPGRVWIITAATPFNPPCETEYLADYIGSAEPLMCTGSDKITECLYLVEVTK
jgi:uncharacterized membrane protein